MKVNGQLEGAQLEQIAADPAVVSRGRIYANIASPTAAVPKFYNGTVWKTLAFADAVSTLVSQNSGSSVTVDWSTGLFQRVVLTGNCVISFSNPQANQTHHLIVTQKTYTTAGTQYQYKLNMTDQDPIRGLYQPNDVLQFQDNKHFQWYYQAGIRAAYATIPANVTAPPSVATLITGIVFHPKALSLAYGQTASPFMGNSLYTDGGRNPYVGAMNKPVAPTAAAAQVVALDYAQDGSAIFYASGTSPFIQGFAADNAGAGTSAAFANPATLPTGGGRAIAVHPSSTHVAIGHTTSPFMSVYPISQAGFGVKLANPASLPAAQVNSLAFSSTGEYLAVASQTTPFMEVYAFDNIAGTIGAKSASPGVLPAGGPAGALGKGIAWRPQGDFIAMAMTTTPFLVVLGFNRITGSFTATKLNGSALASATSVAWTPCGQYLLVGQATAPFMTIYDFANQDLATTVAFDGSAPAVQVNDFAMHPNGEVVIVGLNASPFMATYPMPTKAKNYLRL